MGVEGGGGVQMVVGECGSSCQYYEDNILNCCSSRHQIQ